jgi:hypothetical protein
MYSAYKADLLPANEHKPACIYHPTRQAEALDSGDLLCIPCWLTRRTQGVLTRNVEAVRRAKDAGALDEHEAMVLLRRAERREK